MLADVLRNSHDMTENLSDNQKSHLLLSILIWGVILASALNAGASETVASQEDSVTASERRLKSDTSFGAPSGKTFTEPVTGMVFIWIEGGCFQMGQTESEEEYLVKEVGKFNYVDWFMEELPRHRVCLDGFWMARTEVTRGQFQKFVDAEHFQTDAEIKGTAWIQNQSTQFRWEEGAGRSWKDPGYSQTDAHPVTAVSWNDAKAFIRWLSKRSKQQFALPTEAQWEYAAKAGTSSIRFWGNDHATACVYANALANDLGSADAFPCSDGHVFTAKVASFKPNPWGLYDTLGNVWEWCEDVYDSSAYSKHIQNNPVMTSGEGTRVRRGGGWDDLPGFVREACREGLEADERWSDTGFRLCLPRLLEMTP